VEKEDVECRVWWRRTHSCGGRHPPPGSSSMRRKSPRSAVRARSLVEEEEADCRGEVDEEEAAKPGGVGCMHAVAGWEGS
jgi:hypothetical protein